MIQVGFEPTVLYVTGLKSVSLNHSDTQPIQLF